EYAYGDYRAYLAIDPQNQGFESAVVDVRVGGGPAGALRERNDLRAAAQREPALPRRFDACGLDERAPATRAEFARRDVALAAGTADEVARLEAVRRLGLGHGGDARTDRLRRLFADRIRGGAQREWRLGR